jgi:hypothetical protein
VSPSAGTFESGVLPEPVSPELVLVDPELARRERARLEEKAYLQEVLDVAALRRALEVQPPPPDETKQPRPGRRDIATFSRRRLVPAVLLCSLLANGYLVADVVARRGEQATQVAVRMVTLTASPRETTTSPTASGGTGQGRTQPTTTISRSLATAKGEVERKVVSLILAAPANKLPRDFVDPTTGLVKNNVQVVCRKKQSRSFLCAVRLASETTHKPLYVRYRINTNGKGLFTWYGRSAKVTS